MLQPQGSNPQYPDLLMIINFAADLNDVMAIHRCRRGIQLLTNHQADWDWSRNLVAACRFGSMWQAGKGPLMRCKLSKTSVDFETHELRIMFFLGRAHILYLQCFTCMRINRLQYFVRIRVFSCILTV